MEIFCFFFGAIFYFTKNITVLFFLSGALFLRTSIKLLLFFVAGFLWCWLHVYLVSDQQMPLAQTVPFAQIEGFVDSIPIVNPHQTKFQLFVIKLNSKPVKARVLLSCYQNCPKLSVGQFWSMQAKLLRPRNMQNPGSFDYEGMLATKHIYWVGSVKNGSLQLLDPKPQNYFLLRLREYCGVLLEKFNFDPVTLGVVEALTVGLTTHIDKNHWDLFRRTGVTHLMIISGAHIGLVAGFVYFFVRHIWSRFYLCCVLIPAQRVASIAGLLAASGYSILAGFGVPAQRALIVCVFMLLRFLTNKSWSAWQAWRYALFMIILFEPHSVLLSGSYLSFGAVAILIGTNKRFYCNRFLKAGVLQLSCLIGLMPLTVYFFSYGSMNSFFANIVAIPLVSFILVPLSLFVLFCCSWLTIPGVKIFIKYFVVYTVRSLFKYLTLIDSLSFLNINTHFNYIFIPISSLIILYLIFFCPLKSLIPVCILLFCMLYTHNYSEVKFGNARIDVLDVGQGLSIIVATAKHLLIYDTGMKFYYGGDMASLTIIPYLHTLGVKNIDKIIISHPDLDHRGGLKSLEKAFNVKELIVDDPKFYQRGNSCHAYKDWIWDGVTFHFFAITQDLKSKNNTSCILQIANSAGKVLLTGDIEEIAEKYLVNKYGVQLESTVMSVPHHSSKTSSSLDFLHAVNPKYALSSYGFANRYHFPHSKALERYSFAHIPIYNTLDHGMLRINLSSNSVRLTKLRNKTFN